MTFSLWNLISIVSVVNIMPKDSTCHHGHTGSELLNAHRWYYTLCAHADDLIPVRLRCFFFSHNMPMSADDLQLQACVIVFHIPGCDPRYLHASQPVDLHPECQFLSALQLEFTTPQEFTLGRGGPFFRREIELFAVVSRDSEHMVSHPREWKKLHFQSLAVPSNLFYGQFRSARSQTNRGGYMVGSEGAETDMQRWTYSIQCVGSEGIGGSQ